MRTLLEIVIRTVKSFSADHCNLFAASITYFSLISLFPLILFAIGIAGFFVQSESDQQRIVDELTAELPVSGDGEENLRSAAPPGVMYSFSLSVPASRRLFRLGHLDGCSIF